MTTIKAAVAGASGYAGGEVLRLLLAVREDFLPLGNLSEQFLRQYDAAFVITSWVLSALVVVVTLISGWKYFADHWDLVTAEM